METRIHTQRRNELGKRFSRTLFVIAAGSESKRSHSVAYRFKVASDFFYLTGLEIQEALLVIAGSTKYLLIKSQTNEAAIWDDEGVLSQYEANNLSDVQVIGLERLEEILRTHAPDFDRLAFAVGRSSRLDTKLLSLISFEQRLDRKSTRLNSSHTDISRMPSSA